MSETTVGVWLADQDKTSNNITLTDAALAHIKKEISKRGRGVGIHFGVEKKGCTGFGYVIEIIDQLDKDDVIFSVNEINIAVDQQSFPFVRGTEIDYVKEGLTNHFKFNNPNEKASCGCGESFSVDEE